MIRGLTRHGEFSFWSSHHTLSLRRRKLTSLMNFRYPRMWFCYCSTRWQWACRPSIRTTHRSPKRSFLLGAWGCDGLIDGFWFARTVLEAFMTGCLSPTGPGSHDLFGSVAGFDGVKLRGSWREQSCIPCSFKTTSDSWHNWDHLLPGFGRFRASQYTPYTWDEAKPSPSILISTDKSISSK